MGTVQALPHFVQHGPANKSRLVQDRIWYPVGIGFFTYGYRTRTGDGYSTVTNEWGESYQYMDRSLLEYTLLMQSCGGRLSFKWSFFSLVSFFPPLMIYFPAAGRVNRHADGVWYLSTATYRKNLAFDKLILTWAFRNPWCQEN